MRSGGRTYGLQELWRPNEVEAKIDIVAVHGLNGDALRSWTSDDNDICWLKHPDFLPRYAKNARILSWGYNASLSAVTGEQPSDCYVHDFAATLIAELTADRKLEEMTGRPIIFICHCIGGIIVKRALSYSQTRIGARTEHLQDVFTSTYGILFFGTPHLGYTTPDLKTYLNVCSSRTILQTLLKTLAHRVPVTRASRTVSGLASALEIESETLQNVDDFFAPIVERVRIFFFWEEEASRLFLKSSQRKIVGVESAAPFYEDTERCGVEADHEHMVKFESPSDRAFLVAAEAIERYCRDAVMKKADMRRADLTLVSEERTLERGEAITYDGRD